MSRNVERKVRLADSPAGTLCGDCDGVDSGHDGDGEVVDSGHDGDGDDVDSGHDGDGTFSDTSGKQNVTHE